MRNKISFYVMLVLCIGLCLSVTGCKSSKEETSGKTTKYEGEMLYNGFDSVKDMYRVSQLFEWNYTPMGKLEVVDKDNFLPIVVEDEATIAEQAAQVEKMIDALPSAENVKASDKAAVSEARSAYGALAKSGKLAVKNLDKLKEVEASPALAGLHTIGDLGEDFTSDIIGSGSWLGYSAGLANPMEGTVVFKASGIAANQDGAFYISMFHDGSKDYGQSSDGIAFWVRTMNNTILPENSTNEPIPFKPGKTVSPNKEYTFYVTYKVAADYSKLSVTIRMVEENGSVVAEGTVDVTNFKLTNFGEQTVKTWLGDEGVAKAHQTIYVNPGNSIGVNIKSAWTATKESDYKEAVEVTDICSEEDLAPQQGDGALRVTYERGSFTEILARFDNSLIPDMPVEKLCEASVKIFNYSEEEKKVTLSLMKEQNLAVAMDNNEFTLAPYAWTECKLSMDSVVVEYLAKDLIGLNIRFKDVTDSVYYIDDFRVTFEEEYGEGSLALIEKVEALQKELQGLKDKKITKEDKELLVSLYSKYLELPMAYQYMVDNYDLLQEAIENYYAIISAEELASGSVTILHANEVLGVSQFGEYAGGTVSFTTEDTVDGEGAVSLDFDGSVDYINIPITPTTKNGFSEVHLWVNNPTDNKYAVYLNWKLSDAAVGEAITDDNAVGGYLIPAKSGWVELVYRSEFAVAEINVAMLDKRNEATPATGNILIGKIVGYVNPVQTVSPRVKNVEKLIAALPAYKAGYSKANREAVIKAREAYYALTELQQSQVSNISRLIGIEASIWREGFAGIPKVDAITKYDRTIETKFEALRTAYEALDPATQKAVQKDMELLEKLEDKMATFGKNALHFNESIEQAGIFEGGKGSYTTEVHFADEKGSLKLEFDGSKDWITVPVTPSKVVPFDELHIWVNNTSNHKLAFYPNWTLSDGAIGDKVSGGNLAGGFVLPENSGWIELVYKTPITLSELNIVQLDASGNPAKSTTGTLHVGKANYVYNIYPVINMIDALDGKSMEAIWEARAAYEALIPESQKKVTNLDKLIKLEQALIDDVEALIEALPAYSKNYTSANKKAVREARAAYDNLRPDDKKKVSNISKLVNIETQLASYSETALHFDTHINEVTGAFAGGFASHTTDVHPENESGSLKLDFDGSTGWVTVPIAPNEYKAHDEFRIWVNNDSDKNVAFQVTWNVSDAAIGDCVSGENIEAGYVVPAKSGWVQLIYKRQLSVISELNITALNEVDEGINTSGTVYVGRAEYVYYTNNVIDQIAALDGTDPVAVAAARAAYNALIPESKAKVTNLDKLIGHEADVWRKGFEELPASADAITKYDEAVRTKVKAMLASYENLEPAVQKVTKNDKTRLEAMEAKLAQLQVEMIAEVETLIEQLPAYEAGYSPANKEAVKAARAAYDNLDPANRAQVSNADKLFELEADIWVEGFMELPASPEEMSIYSVDTKLKLQSLRLSYEKLDDAVKAKVAENEVLLAALETKLKTFRETALHFDANINEIAGDGVTIVETVRKFSGGAASYTTDVHCDNEQGSLRLDFDGSRSWLDVPVTPMQYKSHDEFRIWVNNDSDNNVAFYINWKTADAAIGDCVSGDNVAGGYVIPAKSGWVELIYKKQITEITQFNLTALDAQDADIITTGTFYVGRAEYVYHANEVIAQIDALDGTDQQAVVAARVAYDALTAESKANVTNYDKLLEMEALFTQPEGHYTLTDLTPNAYYGNLAQSSVPVGSWSAVGGNLPNAMEGTMVFNATGIAAGVDGAMYISLFHDGSVNAGQANDGIMLYVNSSSMVLTNSIVIPFESGKTITAGQTYTFYVTYKVAEDYSKLTLSVRIELADGTVIADSGDKEVTNFTLSDFGSQTVESWLKNTANRQTLYINGGNSTALNVSAAW